MPTPSDRSWRNLEQRVAQYFEHNGYSARVNVRQPGHRTGLVHEIDVLAEKRDAAGVHRVAVECKAWRSPIEKDVVYKLEGVMRDAGFTKGLIVSVGGLHAGARVAAEQAHIEVWGPDEIRHHLGEEALAGLPLRVPDTALGVDIDIDPFEAERAIRKVRSGFAGIGSEDVASINLVWIPCVEFQLAITRLRPGLIRAREELIRRWVLFEALTGRLIGAREQARSFSTVELEGPVVRQQRSAAQLVAEIRKTIRNHERAKSDAALARRQEALNAVGLPGATREFAVEDENDVFVPIYVGTLRRNASERFVAIHAGTGARIEVVEQALHEKVDVLRRAFGEAQRPTASAQPPEPSEEAKVALPADERVCRCSAPMVLRHRKADGAPFFGCSTFPRCRHTEPAA